SHEALQLLAITSLVSRTDRTASEGVGRGNGLAGFAQGRPIRRHLQGAQSGDGRADLARWRRPAAGAIARDPRIPRGGISAAAALTGGFARAGARAQPRADAGDGRASLHRPARAKISRTGASSR